MQGRPRRLRARVVAAMIVGAMSRSSALNPATCGSEPSERRGNGTRGVALVDPGEVSSALRGAGPREGWSDTD